ncbi:MAG: hypothetical protein ACK5JM_00550 [Rhodoblastus sp.]
MREDGPGFIAALKSQDWSSAGEKFVIAELKLARAAGLPGADFALRLAPLVGALAIHPAEPSSPAMTKAAGGEGGQNISIGA